MTSTRRATIIVALAAVVAVGVYWPGLSGGFLLDDFPNLRVIQRWLEGGTTLGYALTATDSGLFRRPLSFATFALQAAQSGLVAWWLKAFNLALHVIIGVLVFQASRAIYARDGSLRTIAPMAAAMTAAAWLLAPAHVSTVLYIVQRMAQLSTLFVMAGLFGYFVMRQRIETSGATPGRLVALATIVAGATLLATLSKENGVLLPYLVLVAEFTLFAATPERPRPRAIRIAAIALLVVPVLVLMLGATRIAAYLARGFDEREFTLMERVLTQPRVLWSYVRSLLLPDGAMLGLVHDDFPLSRGILTPWSTIPALLAWIALAGAAWFTRRRVPVFAFGIGFFLVAQAMESTVLPLEMYFEHRNYLPSFGLFVAVAALLAQLRVWLDRRLGGERRPIEGLVVIGWLALAILVSSVQARAWADTDTLLRDSLRTHPQSMRLNALALGAEIDQHDYDGAFRRLDAIETFASERMRPSVPLWRFATYCEAGQTPPPTLTRAFEATANARITRETMQALELVVDRIERGTCPGIDADAIVRTVTAQLALADARATRMPVWRTRHNVARVLAAQKRNVEAAAVAERAFRDSGGEAGPGVLAFRLYAELGDADACERIAAALQRYTGRGDLDLDSVVEQFDVAVRDVRAKQAADAR